MITKHINIDQRVIVNNAGTDYPYVDYFIRRKLKRVTILASSRCKQTILRYQSIEI